MEKTNQTAQHSEHSNIILRVTFVILIINVVLTVLKLTFGFLFKNLSVISDAATSIAAILAAILTILSVMVAKPVRDKKYNYGHEKVEPLVILLLSIVLFAIGSFFVWQGIKGIINPSSHKINEFLIAVIIVSIISQECTFHYVMRYARKTNSKILKTDAWQCRIDGLSSIAVLVGLIASIFIGNNIVENIAVVVVAGFIFKVALDIFKPAYQQLTDRAADENAYQNIIKFTEQQPGVIKVGHLRTRVFGSLIYADLVIIVDEKLTTTESYLLGASVHDALRENKSLRIKDCVVVVKPDCLELVK